MRLPVGVTGRGSQHAQMLEPYFLPLPGVKIVAPVKRVAAPNTPAPFSPPMENYYIPSVDRIATGVREVMSF